MVRRWFIPQIFNKHLIYAGHYSKCRGYAMNKTDQNPSLWSLNPSGMVFYYWKKKKEKRGGTGFSFDLGRPEKEKWD